MGSKFAILTSLLLASASLATHSSLEDRLARRRENRQSKPINRVEASSGPDSNVQYSTNWAGAVWSESAGTFTTVTGTFTVPTPSGAGAASAWVGIDGDTCQTAILQTGVDFSISHSGTVSYSAWYEWYPDYAYDFTGFTISAGDVINATVVASSTTSGTAILENLTTGQTVTKALTSTYALCEQDAEWIVEDFEQNGRLVQFADFGSVTFSSASASGPSATYTPSGATILDIEQNGKILTSVATSGDTVTITYV